MTTTVADIRTWLREHGYDVGRRGRIGNDLVSAYDEAHGGSVSREGVTDDHAAFAVDEDDR